jgi:TRAP-type C4-dicarboxylate transport system substrate-binding protein
VASQSHVRRCVCAIVATLLQGVVPVHAQTTIRWQMATAYSDETFHTQNLQRFAQDVADATHGALSIEVHAGGRLAKANEIRARVEAGTIDAGEVIMSSMVADVPVAGADSVPFITSSYADAHNLWRHQRPLVEAALARRGLVVLYAVPWPPQGLYSTRPVSATVDMKSATMRTYNAATVRIAELMGATPVDVPAGQLARALKEGRVDSMITSGVTGVESSAWMRMKYFYDIRAWFPKNIVLVHRASLDALDEPVRDAVRRAATVAEHRGWAASEAAAAASLRQLAGHGVRVESPGFELRHELRRFGEKFSLEWVRATGADATSILIPYYTATPQ